MPSSTSCSDWSSPISWFTHRRYSSESVDKGSKLPLVISTRLRPLVFEIGYLVKAMDKLRRNEQIPVWYKYGAQVIPAEELQTGFFDARLVWRGLYGPLYQSKFGVFCVTVSPKTYTAAQFLRLAHRIPDPSRHDHIQEYRAGVSLDAISPPITLKLNQLEKLWLTDELYVGSMYETKPFRCDERFGRYFQANIDVLYSFRSMVFFPDCRVVSYRVQRKETELLYTLPTYDKPTVLEAFYQTQKTYAPDLMSLERDSRPPV